VGGEGVVRVLISLSDIWNYATKSSHSLGYSSSIRRSTRCLRLAASMSFSLGSVWKFAVGWLPGMKFQACWAVLPVEEGRMMVGSFGNLYF